jgi:hypothetical protein
MEELISTYPRRVQICDECIIYFEHLVLSILAINREQSSVSISPLLKTVWRSLCNILYFAVLLNLCLMDIYSTSQLSLWHLPHIRTLYNKSLARNLHVLFIHQNFNSSNPSNNLKKSKQKNGRTSY